ncbi:Response regulator PleD [Phycisphaerae bacterium RAS1]|nr:Response regulator PleD [Phycisphaerae bacterium RAS1]
MAASESNPAPGGPGGPSPRGATVLIADDNPQILELLEAYLEPLELRIVTATDGEAALAAVRASPPDLLLLDVMMPKRSGFEVSRMLKDDPQFQHIPIIVVTALNELGDEERARECGADDFISKPVNKLVLLDRVQRALARRAT